MAVAPRVDAWTRRAGGFASLAAGPLGPGSGGGSVTFTATYNGDLSRVQLLATGLPSDTTRVEIWRYRGTVLTGGVMVRGSDLAAASGDTIAVDDYEFADNMVNTYQLRVFAGAARTATALATVTPALTSPWLKSIARPFLNRTVTIIGFTAVDSPARGAVFEVLGRRLPVAVTDVRGSRRYTLLLRAADRAEADALELALSFGDVLMIHVPDGCVVPRSMYAYVGDVSSVRAPGKHDTQVRYLSLPLTEVAAPDPSIVGYTVTWAGIVAAFATWADVLATFPTWLDVQSYISAPSDEIVG